MNFKEKLQKCIIDTEPIAMEISNQIDILMTLFDKWEEIRKQIKLDSYLQAEYNKNIIISNAQNKIIKLADKLN